LQAALVAALVAALESAMACYSWDGVTRPVLLPGSIGPDALCWAAHCCRCTPTLRSTVRCS
jgi:hypothetical protein